MLRNNHRKYAANKARFHRKVDEFKLRNFMSGGSIVGLNVFELLFWFGFILL